MKVVVGNWKMYKSSAEAVSFIKALIPRLVKQVYLAVPFTAIEAAAAAAHGTPIIIGAQNMHDASEGAYTGEIAAKMLVSSKAQFVILGHSERRRIFHETNELINKKVLQALANDLEPILCVGETLDERQNDLCEQVLTDQLTKCLAGVSHPEKLMIAYEPVWAIGTGVVAKREQIESAHALCRLVLSNLFSLEIATKIKILYGGSVTGENAAAIMSCKDVDGVLVGGASLKVDSFEKIIASIE